MSARKPSPLSPLNRARFWTRVVMAWERLVPVIFPFILLVMLIAVAGQWGVFLLIPAWVHLAVLVAGGVMAAYSALRAALRFRMPDFVELNTRVAIDNGLKPERILAMRHQLEQPPLKVGRPKAGIAAADPFALRYVALVGAMLGFLVLGPVPMSRVTSGFCPFHKTPVTFADRSLAEK